MKRLRQFLSVLGVLITFTMGFAVDTTSPPPLSIGKIVLRSSKPASNRPNTPSNVSMTCVYGNGFLIFEVPQGISSLTVEISNETDQWNAMLALPSNILETPEFNGDYGIICTADDGRVFCGLLSFPMI